MLQCNHFYCNSNWNQINKVLHVKMNISLFFLIPEIHDGIRGCHCPEDWQVLILLPFKLYPMSQEK